MAAPDRDAQQNVPRMDLLAELRARGLIHDATDEAALGRRLADGPIAVYYGCDPSADSLHHGNLIGLIMLRRFQRAGHTVIALAGGATGMVGDPTGRSAERNLLDDATLDRNVAAIKSQIARIVDLDGEAGVLVDNRDWTQPMSVLEFLRDVGRHATVNQMLARESVRARLESEQGISFTEFSYMLLQANDYLWLHDHLGCELQVGGSDQWGNILSGVDLIRRSRSVTAHAMAWPLLTGSDGSKLGKTSGARVWLDPARTSPYQWHQHWMQVDDDAVASQFPMFSLRPLDEIHELLAEHASAPERRLAQRALADELTTLVHGRDAAAAAAGAADVLFGGDPAAASMETLDALAAEVPTTRVSAAALADPVALLADIGVATSRSDARRLLDQGSIRANGAPLGPDDDLGGRQLLHGAYLLLRRGKRTYHLVEISGRPG